MRNLFGNAEKEMPRLADLLEGLKGLLEDPETCGCMNCRCARAVKQEIEKEIKKNIDKMKLLNKIEEFDGDIDEAIVVSQNLSEQARDFLKFAIERYQASIVGVKRFTMLKEEK